MNITNYTYASLVQARLQTSKIRINQGNLHLSLNQDSFQKLLLDLTKDDFAFSDTLIDQDFCKALSQTSDLLNYQGHFKNAKTGGPANLSENHSIRGDKIFWLEPEMENPICRQFLELLKQMQTQLNQELFLGLKEVECHFARYEAGLGYDRHMDRQLNSHMNPQNGSSKRILTFILYLNEGWLPHHSGELVVFQPDNQNEICYKVEPKIGRFVLFLSEIWPHQVLASTTLRKSLTGWFRS